jgi:hypothetical protein
MNITQTLEKLIYDTEETAASNESEHFTKLHKTH